MKVISPAGQMRVRAIGKIATMLIQPPYGEHCIFYPAKILA
jgi:hypothetical protein